MNSPPFHLLHLFSFHKVQTSQMPQIHILPPSCLHFTIELNPHARESMVNTKKVMTGIGCPLHKQVVTCFSTMFQHLNEVLLRVERIC